MTKTNLSLLFVLCLLINPFSSYATNFTAVADGDWNSPATWGAFSVPGSGDDVIIDGHIIHLTNADVIVNNLTITNSSNTGESRLEVKGDHTLDILGDFTVTAVNEAKDVKLMIYETAIVTVIGNMLMERSSDNMQSNILQLLMYDSGKLLIDGSFDYIYGNSDGEAAFDIQMYDTAEFRASKPSSFVQNAGEYFFVLILGSAKVDFLDSLDLVMIGGKTLNVSVSVGADLMVGDDLSLTNTGGNNYLSLNANTGGDVIVKHNIHINSQNADKIALLDVTGTGSTIDVEGDIIYKANTVNSAKINIGNDASLSLAGNLLRPDKYGTLSMNTNGSVHFDGTEAQVVPRNKYAEIADDSLVFTNIFFENTSSTGLILDGNLVVTSDLTLNDGIINTSADSLLIIADGANISSANSNSYVDGPMVKKGLHSGTGFTFPIGNNGIYAPIGITEILDTETEYTAEFIGCPPPVGGVILPIKSVNQHGYWQLSRADGSNVGDINLHWDDADASGITDLSSLEIGLFDAGAVTYSSLGRGTVSGGVGLGVSGYISNDIGCPPPVSNGLFVLMSTDLDENALPVEMTSFRAIKSADHTQIYLEWSTASEINSDYFVVEKSYDGISFHPIDRVAAAQNSTVTRRYASVDEDPAQGNNYYRIQQVDLDQTMSFSRLVNVFMNDQNEVRTIYPNPVEDHMTVYSSTLGSKEIILKVLDLKGQVIYSGPQVAQDGQIMLSAANLNIKNPGVYFINYEEAGSPVSLKFMKVK